MFVNTWWFQHRQFTQPDSHMAVLEARTLVHADTGAPTVRFSLSTGTPSSGLNNSQEVSELRVTDTMELPGVLLGSDSSFALSDQLTFIDVKHISTPRSDNETALVPDRVFFVPVGFHSDWNSRTGFANVSTSALLLLRVLWDVADTTPGSASHSDEGSATNEFRATFDTDILLWAAEQMQMPASIVSLSTETHHWGCRESNETSMAPLTPTAPPLIVPDKNVQTPSFLDNTRESSQVPTVTPAWWNGDTTSTPLGISPPAESTMSFQELEPLDLVELLQGYDADEICAHTQKLVAVATPTQVSIFHFAWPDKQELSLNAGSEGSRYTQECPLADTTNCILPDFRQSSDNGYFQLWYLTDTFSADSSSQCTSPLSAITTSLMPSYTEHALRHLEFASVQIVSSRLRPKLSLGDTADVETAFAEQLWILAAVNPSSAVLSVPAFFASALVPSFGRMDDTSIPSLVNPSGATTNADAICLNASTAVGVAIPPSFATADSAFDENIRIRQVVGTWRDFSLNLDAEYETVCNVSASDFQEMRQMGIRSECNDAVLDALNLRCSDCNSDTNDTVSDGGLGELLASQYGARFVFFIVDSANRVHVLHASAMRGLLTDLVVQVQSTLKVRTQDSLSSLNVSDERVFSTVTPVPVAHFSKLDLQLVNVANFDGSEISGIDVTDNGQFVFVTQRRRLSTLEAMERAVEVCAGLGMDETLDGELSRWYNEVNRLALGEQPPEFTDQQCVAGAAIGDSAFGGSSSCAKPLEETLHLPSYGDFVSVLSACSPSGICPSFSKEAVIDPMPAGNFSRFGFDSQPCPRGCYCQSAARIPCNLGFMCPEEGLEYPQRCAHDTSRSNTCYENGLTEPVACPAGTLCVAPYAPAIPAAPGFLQVEVPYSVVDAEATTTTPLASPTTRQELTFYQTRATLDGTFPTLTTAAPTNLSHAATTQLLTISPINSVGSTTTLLKRVLLPCSQGYYCNSGRSASEDVQDLLCPASTYCLAPDVLEPVICDQRGNCTTEGCDVISSCPAGSTSEALCPAGFYCTDPDGNSDHIIQCRSGSYCPAGSVLWKICAAGFYCPDPTQQLLCEEGSYCPEGSVLPWACGVFEVCPEGAATPQIYFSVVILCGVPILILAFCVVAQACLLRLRARRHARRLHEAIKEAEVSFSSPITASVTGSRATTTLQAVELVEVEHNSPATKVPAKSTSADSSDQVVHTATMPSSSSVGRSILPEASDSATSPASEIAIIPNAADAFEVHQKVPNSVNGSEVDDPDTEADSPTVDASSIDFALSGMSPFNTIAQHHHRARAHSKRLRARSRSRSRSGSLGSSSDGDDLNLPSPYSSNVASAQGSPSLPNPRPLSCVVEEADLEAGDDEENSDDVHEDADDELEHELSIFARAGMQRRTLASGQTVDLKLRTLAVVKPSSRKKQSLGTGNPAASAQSGLAGDEKVLLQGLSGQIRHGELTAVMGPTGSGKTLFLQALAGKVPRQSLSVGGTLTVNGCMVPAEVGLSMLSGQTGYVPKEDTMMRTLTVKENLVFSARSRVSRPASSHRGYIKLVEGVIDILGLYSIRHSAIGDENTRGISGGQRKRVNIGIELVAEPTVLLLDEPTSGLDATCASEVCSAMKALAKLGLTVVSVIHQPRYEIYRIFDALVLLDSDGRCAFFGESVRATLHFTRTYGWTCPADTNPADFLMDALKRLDTLKNKNVQLVDTGVGSSTLLFGRGDSSDSIRPRASSFALAPPTRSDDNAGFPQFSPMRNGERPQVDVDPFGADEAERRGSLRFDAEHRVDRYEVEKLERQLPPPRHSSGILVLLWLCFWRSIIQQTRSKSGWAIDNILVLLCAMFLGLLYMEVEGEECNDCEWMSPGQPKLAFTGCAEVVVSKYQPLLVQIGDQVVLRGTMCMIAMGITSATSAMRVFQNERHE
eukprot:INCI9964.2.p1 GENE.INCI9964.2~~INCI9964.2.p1  ORF type:complete len:1921 (-),score=289.02 INCI9964.2:865-6627(-)